MMYRYIYISKKNGVKVYSNEKLDDPNLELITEMRTVNMKPNEVNKKANKKR